MKGWSRVRFERVGVLLASLLFGRLADSQELPRAEWQAKWIDHPTAPLREPMVFHFRKALSLTSHPQRYLVHVSADNRFVLYVNGKRVGDGPARGDLQHWRYQTFDLAPYLETGKNVVAANVWNFGIYSPMAQVSDRTAFLLEGDTAAEAAVNTDASWQVEVESGHTALQRPENRYKEYFVAGPGERVEGSKYDWAWKTGVDGPNSHWVQAGPAMRESILFDGSHPWPHDHRNDTPWLLEPDQLPHMTYQAVDSGETKRAELPGAHAFPAKPVVIPAHRTTALLIARDAVTTAYPRLTVSGGRGSEIRITYAGALVDAGLKKGIRTEIGNRQALGLIDEFAPDGGERRVFEPLWWRGYRFLELSITTADEPLTLDSLETQFTAYPFDRHGYFRSSDADLNRVWETAWYTGTLNAHETYVDSAAVEQLQYVADMRPQALVSYAVTGDDRLARQAITAIDDSRTPEGPAQARYPNNIFQITNGYSLLWIGMVHDYWTWRPDIDYVRGRLLGTRTVLDWFNHRQGQDGMLGRLPFGIWQDWIGKDNRDFPREDRQGRSAIITLEYVIALRQAAELERSLGYGFLADEYVHRASQAAEGTYRLCWDQTAGLLADTPDHQQFSQQTNALAVLADVIPKQDQQALLRRMAPEEYPGTPRTAVKIDRASYYHRFYTAQAMDHAGMSADFPLMLKPWVEMTHQGFTTFPETPEPTREEAQGWGAHPAFQMLTLMAGIQPSSLGFHTVRVEPHLGALARLDAGMESPAGLIETRYALRGGKLEATITLPSGLSGTFVWNKGVHELHAGSQSFVLPALAEGGSTDGKGN